MVQKYAALVDKIIEKNAGNEQLQHQHKPNSFAAGKELFQKSSKMLCNIRKTGRTVGSQLADVWQSDLPQKTKLERYESLVVSKKTNYIILLQCTKMY